MIENNFDIRVRYSDTDQMGYLYYSRYANFYEIARVELFRKFCLHLSYYDEGEMGVIKKVGQVNLLR